MENGITREQAQIIVTQVDQLYKAVVGDNMGNPGLVKRIEKIESDLEEQKKFKEKIMTSAAILISIAGLVGWLSDKLFDLLFNSK